MPTAQELKRAWEALDAQIAAAKQEEREAEEARLQAKEEAHVATEKARYQGFSRVSPFGSLYCSFTPFCLRSCLLIKHP